MIKKLIIFLSAYCLSPCVAFSQRGAIIKAGDSLVFDPNLDGYISVTNSGFSNDGYYVDEFEIPMFGIPIVGDGEVLNDNQVGPNCGTTDLTVDSRGFSVYGVLDNNGNLIFRFRVARNLPSVEAYSILIDTDGKIGSDDPNTTPENPGFEIDITLIKNSSKGVYVFDINGIDVCPVEDLSYSYDSNFQISIADIISCGDPDFFYDIYVPFNDLATRYGISDITEIRFVALTNISATCAMAGKISDVGGVDDTQYGGCNTCSFLDLSNNQCPTALVDLCPTCRGFLSGVTPKPTIDTPLKANEFTVFGTSIPEAEIFLDVFDASGSLRERDTTLVDSLGLWAAQLETPLAVGDSVTARSRGTGLCQSGTSSSGTSYTIVIFNQAPVLTGSIVPLMYSENDLPTLIDPDLLITDPDDTYLDSASIIIESNFIPLEDILTYVLQPGITGSPEPGLGRIVFYGRALLSEYQSLLRSIDYFNTSENPNTSPKSISFKVYDGSDYSNVFSRAITIIPINDPPLITGRSSPVVYSSPSIVIDSTINIIDVDHNELQGALIAISNNYISGEDSIGFIDQNGITGVFNGTTGELTLSGPATIGEYQEALSGILYINSSAIPTTLTRSVSFTANDGTNSGDPFHVFIDLPGVNNPPVIVDDNLISTDTLFYYIEEDNPLDTCVIAIDPDGDPVVIDSFINSSGNGTYLSGGLCFTFAPLQNFNGTEISNVVICDRSSPNLCDTAVVVIKVTPANDAPSVGAITVTVVENTTTSICAEFSDVEGDTAVFTGGGSLTGSGSFSDSNPTDLCFDYTPNPDFTGQDQFEVSLCDANDVNVCSTGTIIINVIPAVNQPPLILVDGLIADTTNISTTEDTPVVFCFESIDREGDDVVFSSQSNIFGGGSLSLYSNIEFCFEFVPDLNFNGLSYWLILICDDANPGLCADLIAVIDVLPVNDAPTAMPDTVLVFRRETATGNLVINDFELEGDLLTVNTSPFVPPSHGTAVLFGNGDFSYISDIEFTGIDSLIYSIADDGSPSRSANGKLTIIVEDQPLRIYQGFSPNGDGINDYWRIDRIDYYINNQVRIFDRYNNAVFELKGYDNEEKVWKGEANLGINRSTLPEGEYFYVIDLGDGSASYKGFVVLKKN